MTRHIARHRKNRTLILPVAATVTGISLLTMSGAHAAEPTDEPTPGISVTAADPVDQPTNPGNVAGNGNATPGNGNGTSKPDAGNNSGNSQNPGNGNGTGSNQPSTPADPSNPIDQPTTPGTCLLYTSDAADE